MISKDLQVGVAGEYLACCDLTIKGFVAYPTQQGLPYDVLLDIDGKLLKVQVKTTTEPRKIQQRSKETVAYIFGVKRHGKRNDSVYGLSDVDVFALVCLDTMKVGYVKNCDMPSTMNLRVDSLRGSYYDEKGVADSAIAKEMYKKEKNKSEIARIMGKNISQIHRYLEDGYEPFETSARYFSDIERETGWFYGL